MTCIGYHASHEQFSPRELVQYVHAAEDAGFASVMSSDHLAPWSKRQGESGFVWAFLGAAMQATREIPFGLITIPSGWRYHPVITAQAAATIAELFPGRFPWMAVGSGQALSEHVVGERWPSKPERNERLKAGAEIIRSLWAGELVSRHSPIKVDEARLYTLPPVIPKLVAGALSPETAAFVGRWADALITVNQPIDSLNRIIEAFRNGGGDGKPIYLQVHLSFAATQEEARANAFDQWRSNAMSAAVSETLRSPEEFDAASAKVRPEDMDEYVHISCDPSRHVAWLQDYAAMGFEEIYVHNVGRNQRQFIDVFGSKVLPLLAERSPA